jgi:hypothetical protein
MGGEFFTILAAGAVEVVVDNSDPGFSLRYPDQWGLSTADSDYGANYHYTLSSNDGPGNWVKWTPSLPAAGNYRIAVWWVSNNSNRDHHYLLFRPS